MLCFISSLRLAPWRTVLWFVDIIDLATSGMTHKNCKLKWQLIHLLCCSLSLVVVFISLSFSSSFLCIAVTLCHTLVCKGVVISPNLKTTRGPRTLTFTWVSCICTCYCNDQRCWSNDHGQGILLFSPFGDHCDKVSSKSDQWFQMRRSKLYCLHSMHDDQ